MAEFTEVAKEIARMCKGGCMNCILGPVGNKYNLQCIDFIAQYPNETEWLIQDWARRHPVKTNRDKFKEMFGIDLDDASCAGFRCDGDCDGCEHEGFWNRAYKEVEK